MLTYGSVCSGIEAATVAWEHIGWRPSWFAEIEPFPAAVLNAHWPSVPNLGDMTKIAAAVSAGDVEAPDILVGGTPCQAFSVAGLRNGLADERGQLTLSYVELLDAIDNKRAELGKDPAVAVWENVPGVLSSKDNAFGAFLGGLAGETIELQPAGGKWANAGCVYGPQRAIAWRVLDAQYFGVAQRRRRVFVVASARQGFDPGAVLFELESVRRDTPPRRGQGAPVAADVDVRANGSHWDHPTNPHPTLNQSNNDGGIGQSNQELFSQRGAGIVPAAFGGGNTSGEIDVATTCTAHGSRLDFDTETFAVSFAENCRGEIRFQNGDGQISGPLSTGGGKPGQGYPAICIQHASIGRSDNTGPQGKGFQEDLAFTQDSRATADAVQIGMQVRRLTPCECERLQGFPDNFTLIPWHGKDADHCPDGPRYRAIGNSMAVPVMRWIGERIAAALPAQKTAGDFGGSFTPTEQRDCWRTPPEIFAALEAEFFFQVDAAASADNALCRRYITQEQNTLVVSWADLARDGYVWLNPPYSNIAPFVQKAAAEKLHGVGCVMLLPADTSVGWFRQAIETASEVRFITSGRLSFINPVTGKPVNGNNKGSMLIIWHPHPRTECKFCTVSRDDLMQFGRARLDKRASLCA